MKKYLRTLILIAALVSSVSITKRVAAQYTNPYTGNTFNNPVSSFLDTVIQNNMQTQNLLIQQNIQRSILEQSIKEQRGATEQTSTTPRSGEDDSIASDRLNPAVTTSFDPVATSLVPKQIAARISNKPEEQQEYEQNFNTLLDFYKSYVQEWQWQLNDVAHAMSYYIGANYYVYTDGKDLSDRQRTALYETVSKVLAEGKEFQALSNADKQAMYEVMAIQGSLPLLGYRSAIAEGDRKNIAKFRQSAQQNLEDIFGVPLTQVQFTDQGIVINK